MNFDFNIFSVSYESKSGVFWEILSRQLGDLLQCKEKYLGTNSVSNVNIVY